MTKKILTHLLTIAIILSSLLASASPAQANIFNKFREGFYFEKYSTVEEAKEEILKLHPIGSDTDELIKTLEKAGAKKVQFIKRTSLEKDASKTSAYFTKTVQHNPLSYSTINISKNATSLQITEYQIRNLINPIAWKCLVWMDDQRKIIDIALSKGYMGL